MKYYIALFLFVVIFAYAKALLSQTEQIEAVQLCANQTGIAPKICVYKYVGLQDQQGNMNFEKIREQLKNDFFKYDTDSVVDTCSNVKGTTHEDNAYLATQCILKQIRKISNAQKANKN
ncbi:hypothetical protein Trydic_g2041 [Trypoxylus dichotomus]